MYSRRSAAADRLWEAQDRFRSGLPAAADRGADLLTWPFERATFALRKKLIWPAQDRAETMGAPARTLAGGAVVLLAAAAGVAGLLWAAPDGPHRDAGTTTVARAAEPPAVAQATPLQAPQPTLHGATPVFEPAKPTGASDVDPAKAIVKSAPADAAPPATASSSSSGPSSTASAAAANPEPVDGPPAGPRAIAVAGDFAGAFVLYETGENDSGVRQAFAETATPALAKALLRRPPRLPANVEVPKAKVVNVVPAPSHGGIFPVSVSLLRVGLTSELRLEMEKRKADGWRVVNVLG